MEPSIHLVWFFSAEFLAGLNDMTKLEIELAIKIQRRVREQRHCFHVGIEGLLFVKIAT